MKETIVAKLKERGYNAEINNVVKNGVNMCVLIIKTENNISPSIYIDDYLNCTEGELDSVVNEIIDTYKTAVKNMPNIDTKLLMDWNYVSDNLQLCVQRKGNEDILKEDFLDLEMYVRVKVSDEGSFKVKPVHLEKYGIERETLFTVAKECTENWFTCQTMFDMLKSLMPENLNDFDDFDVNMMGAIPMYVLTNESKTHGASVMCFEKKLKIVADKLNDDLYILPSSIHEIIVVPAKGNEEERLTGMVREVNATQVDTEEQLSDHIYYYDRAANKVLLK